MPVKWRGLSLTDEADKGPWRACRHELRAADIRRTRRRPIRTRLGVNALRPTEGSVRAFTRARRLVSVFDCDLFSSLGLSEGCMKNAFLGLMLIGAWLVWFPASAATYNYNFSFAIGTGDVTGSIALSCDLCVLTSSDVLSWSFTASDGASASSSDPGAGISSSGVILDATPTGIYTAAYPTLEGYFAFCDNASNCFNPAGLQFYNFFHGDP